jgi:hypothetical protein
MTSHDLLVLLASLSLTLTTAACTSADVAPSDDTDTNDDALTTGAPSGYAECTGTGWTNTVAEWRGVKGSYMRAGGGFGLAASGTITSLTVLADPSDGNQGTPRYLRTVDHVAQSGRVELGVDNPAIGPAIRFLDEANETRDLFWVLAKKKTITGKVAAICIVKAAGATGEALPAQKPYMLSRVGL